MRDQTRRTQEKVHRQRVQHLKASRLEGNENPVALEDNHSFRARNWPAFSAVFPLALQPSPSTLEELSISRFFSNFVLVPRHHESIRGFLDCLPPLYNTTPEGSVLHLATLALSLAINGSHPSCRTEAILSQKFFGEALVMTNSAVQDSIDSVKDETLMAVLLLSLFEVSAFLISMLCHIRHFLRAGCRTM